MRYGIITGAANGLGRAIAIRLAQDGWRLALVDIDPVGCQTTLEAVEAAGGSGEIDVMDVGSIQSWESLRTRLQRDWPQLDLLVNNAGVCGSGEVGEFPLDDWHWLLDTNLFGVINGCHTMIGWLKANPHGAHLMNTASVAAFAAAPAMPAYNVAKAGVVALSETLRTELAGQGVSVSVLCPGFVATGLLDRGRFSQPQQRSIAERFMQQSALTPTGIAEAAVRAIYRKQFYVVEGRRARTLWRIKRWFPRLYLRLMAFGYRRNLAAQQGSEPTPSENDLVFK